MCQRGSHDVKELIPELFYLSEMFKNENEYELGTMSENGHKVDDVVLPSWAKVNAKRNSTKQKTNRHLKGIKKVYTKVLDMNVTSVITVQPD